MRGAKKRPPGSERPKLQKGDKPRREPTSALPSRFARSFSARLKTLEREGIIGTRLYEAHPPRYEYFLTEKGKALDPVLKALYGWGERY